MRVPSRERRALRNVGVFVLCGLYPEPDISNACRSVSQSEYFQRYQYLYE